MNARDNLLQVLDMAVTAMYIKARDRREPGLREKAEGERRLEFILRRVFRKQSGILEARIRERYPELKADTLDDDLEWDDEDIADLVRALQEATRNGVALFGKRNPLQIDYTLTNAEAALAAREYAFGLIRDIQQTSIEVIRRVIAGFVLTPGATLQDVIDLLPFNEQRAQMIAVTEITRAYATGEIMAGQAVAREFPDVVVKKRWFTNNDDRVCTICGPLEGMEIDIDDGFTTDEIGSEGLDSPPAHPNCRCWIETYTVLGED